MATKPLIPPVLARSFGGKIAVQTGVVNAPTLSTLSLTANTFISGSMPGTTIGFLQGLTSGASLFLTNSNAAAVELVAPNVIQVGASAPAIPGTFDIELVEVLDGATNSPNITIISIASIAIDLTPVNVSPPYILGVGQVGQTLTATPGTWTNSPSFLYTFYRNNLSTPITTPSISPNYTATTDDIGQTIYVGVTGANVGSSIAYSAAPTYAAYQTTIAGAVPAFVFSVPSTPPQENNHLHQSPNGRYIGMSSYTLTPFNEGVSYLGTEILLLDTTTGITSIVVPADPTQNNSNPNWWPDSLSFLYASTNMVGGPNPTHHGARRYFPASATDVIFYNPAMNVADFSVSPTSAVVMGGTTTINGFITDALFIWDGSTLTQLTTPDVTASFNPSGDFDPQWSPSGNYISCSRSISPGLFTIVVINVTGPPWVNVSETIITPPGSAAAFDGVAPWSDNDQNITTWYTDPANRAANGIYVMSKDGTSRRRINLQAQEQFNTPSFVPGSGSSSSAQILYSTQSLPIFEALPVNISIPTIS